MLHFHNVTQEIQKFAKLRRLDKSLLAYVIICDRGRPIPECRRPTDGQTTYCGCVASQHSFNYICCGGIARLYTPQA